MKYICPNCEKEFEYEPKNSKDFRRRYCSSECMNEAIKNGNNKYTICLKCGTKFEREITSSGGMSEKLYCSSCCNENKYCICEICNSKFLKSSKYKGKYCETCREQLLHQQTHRHCTNCGKEFKIKRLDSGKLSGQLLCDNCVQLQYKKAHFGICQNCGKEFEYETTEQGYISKSKYCSDACFEESFNKNKSKYYYKQKQTNLERYGVAYACLLPQCKENQGIIISKINLQFADLLEKNNIKYEKEFVLSDDNTTYSYDFYIVDTNILIEINPTFTHTCISTGVYVPKQQNYHLDKTNFALKRNYRCIHVWDWDDWNKIIYLIKSKQKLYARKLKLRDISKQEANKFLNKYHLQNSCYGNQINLGLFDNNELVQVMTFGKPRYNKNYQYELLRLCSHSNYMIVGGAEKLFKYFVDNYNPKSVISYCDVSKFSGEVYKKLGLKLKHITVPQKIWSNKQCEYVTDNLLRQRGFDQLIGSKLNPPKLYGKGTDNEELMVKYKWLPIYDCGQKVFGISYEK